MDIYVKCEFSEGMFESEYAVSVKHGDTPIWAGWVDKSLVQETTIIAFGDVKRQGIVKAYLVNDYRDGNMMVEFPEVSLSSRRVKIPACLIQGLDT